MPVVGAAAGDLTGMGIESAQRAEKDLPVHAEHAANADHFRDLFELIAERRPGTERKWCNRGVAGGTQRLFQSTPLRADAAGTADQREVRVRQQDFAAQIARIPRRASTGSPKIRSTAATH